MPNGRSAINRWSCHHPNRFYTATEGDFCFAGCGPDELYKRTPYSSILVASDYVKLQKFL